MIAVPFIYFSILFFIQYFRNKSHIDIACFIFLIYAVSGFFSIQIEIMGLRYLYPDSMNYKITLFPTLLYCVLISICVLPMSLYSSSNIRSISKIRNDNFLKFIAWLSIFYFIFYSYMSADRIVQVLTGDFRELRSEIYAGLQDESWILKLSPILRLPVSFMNGIFACPWILQFFAFFSLLVQKISFRYFIFFILGSCLTLVQSIVGVDRSGVAYWILGIIACYIIFQTLMNKKQKRYIRIIGLSFLSVAGAYLVYSTISRFGESDQGTEGGLVSYLGQTFINFCYFFEEFECPYPTLNVVFPFSSWLLLGDEFMEGVRLNEFLSLLSQKQIGVFYSFLGGITIKSGRLVTFLYAISLCLLSFLCLKREKTKNVDLKYVFIYYYLSSIPFLGIFLHYYGYSGRSFSVIFFFLYILFFLKKSK